MYIGGWDRMRGKRKIGLFVFIFVVLLTSPLWGSNIQVAPRISDKEIIERLTRLEEGQKALNKRIDDVNKRIDDVNKRIDALERSLNKRIDEVERSLNKRIDEVEWSLNKRIDDLRAEMNDRFNTLQWMLGLFISISLVILGFVLRMQWQMQFFVLLHR